MTVGENLRRIRRERGFKQTELAEAAGTWQQTISEIERGGDSRTATLEKLAGALGVPVADFFAEDDGPPPIPPRPTTPLTDEPSEDFDRRFAATDATSAEVLQARVDKEFEAIRQYIKQLKAAGIGADAFQLKQARASTRRAKRRLYAITSRATDLGINADFGGDRPIYDTVEAYVGKAEEVDERHGEEERRSRTHPKAS
jgi:transcriptional regulator with XRE-family HTH domain